MTTVLYCGKLDAIAVVISENITEYNWELPEELVKHMTKKCKKTKRTPVFQWDWIFLGEL